jgi:ABC-type lipoprotein export system ATPase subunit
MWHDLRKEELISTDQLASTYLDELPAHIRNRFFKMPEWFENINKRLKVHLIETQRLLEFSDEKSEARYGKSREGVTAMVQKYSTELKQGIGDTLTEYAKSSQVLDQSFPQRLLSKNPASNGTLTVEELKQRMEALDEKRAALKRIGLVDEDRGNPFDASKLDSLEGTEKAAMTLYVGDTAQKLGVLDELANRLTLLLENVNKKFKNKSIGIDKKQGLVAINKDGNPLDLESLSSGEQHELVLIYDLLFRVSPDTLVLIDEPELSLHVTWQKVFVDDLSAIVKAAGFDVLLATHSPFIAGDRHDLMISLPPVSE